MKRSRLTILTITIIFVMLLVIIPANAEQLNTKTPDGKYSNPYPDKVFGEQFRSPERPWVIGRGVTDMGPTWEVKWTFVICLTDEQMDQYVEWRDNNWDMPLIDALTQLVPEQVAALPDDLVRYLQDHTYITVGHDPVYNTMKWSTSDGGLTWTDPCGTAVPAILIPRYYYPGDALAVALWSDEYSTYTLDVQSHLANLGLATDRRSLDPEFSTAVQNGAYIVTFEANTLQGERASWILIHKSDGSWTDAATGEEISDDLHYVLAAFTYATSPDYTSPPVLAEIAVKASSIGSVRSFDVAAQSQSVSSPASSTLANTLLSQAGTSKLSKVNISSIAATRATVTSTASTATLVSQDKVSSSGETPEGGNFDMASFAASYSSGGSAIASKSFGSEGTGGTGDRGITGKMENSQNKSFPPPFPPPFSSPYSIS